MGTGLAKLLRQSYGAENVILSDIIKPSNEIINDGEYLIYRLILQAFIVRTYSVQPCVDSMIK